jgi:hypothetical protein
VVCVKRCVEVCNDGIVEIKESMDEEREPNEVLRVLDVSCSCRNVECEA